MATTTTTETKHLTDTAELVDKHVKETSTTGVSAAISKWIKTLGEYEELHGIAADLEDLKTALSDKDGKKIASLLSKLGTDTTKASESAEGAEATKIKALGAALSAGGKAIGKLAK